MLIRGIEYPEDLVRAQSEGGLVIFAGAGVSVPSGLPSFEKLAKAIGKDTSLQKERNEPEDRYLGRLEKTGVHVHELAARILLDETSQPHELHRYLLQLFQSPANVRLVTTNFDGHFSKVLDELYPGSVDTYCAPALPLGNDFAGLVYLHGSAVKNLKRCVLTDSDFGRAYLTEAWASRFLAAMFARYTVLFVGYSHNDPVMHYLARGLPPIDGKRRFAFSHEGQEHTKKWEFLGIRPLVYKKCDEPNPHSAITNSVGAWVKDLCCGFLEKSNRIRSIAEASPPLPGEDADYIKFCLKDKSKWPIFFTHARHPEWIGWLEGEGFAKHIFEWNSPVNAFDDDLSKWLVDHFLFQSKGTLLAAIQRNISRIHPNLARRICRRICLRRAEQHGPAFSTWTALLLTQPRFVLNDYHWWMLLEHCRLPEDKGVALSLFDFLTKPQVLLDRHTQYFESSADATECPFQLNLLENLEHHASNAWSNFLSPNLDGYASDFLPIVIANLNVAHCLNRPGRQQPSGFDPFHFRRRSISGTDDSFHIPSTIDILIDAAKQIVDHLLRSNPTQAAALLTSLTGSEMSVLQGLAIYGHSHRTDITSDEKLRWLRESSLVYRFEADVFEFLKACYPTASAAAKLEFLRLVLAGPPGRGLGQLEYFQKNREVFKLIYHLKAVAPDCEITREALNRLKLRVQKMGGYPGRINASGRSWVVDRTAGFDLDRIGKEPPQKFLMEFLEWQPRDVLDDGDPRCALASVVAKNPTWGFEWIRALLDQRVTEPGCWKGVCQGWREAKLTDTQWSDVLRIAETVGAPRAFFVEFVDILEHACRSEQPKPPDGWMERAERVAIRIWECVLGTDYEIEQAPRDWLATAINRPGGKLAQFWLRRIGHAKTLAVDSWKGLPADLKEIIASMLRSRANDAVHARVVFASQLHYFYYLDSDFARTELLHFFDWKSDSLKAEQAWHGFLYWGRWHPAFTEVLLPYFKGTLGRLPQLPDELRQRAISHSVSLAVFYFRDPIDAGWMGFLAETLDANEWNDFTARFGEVLRGMDTALVMEVWDRWLRRYWENLLLGAPRKPSREEGTMMVRWSLKMGDRFPQAVDLILRMQELVAFEDCLLLDDLHTLSFAKSHPVATAKFLSFVLKSKPESFYPKESAISVYRDLRSQAVDSQFLREIRESLLQLGCLPESLAN